MKKLKCSMFLLLFLLSQAAFFSQSEKSPDIFVFLVDQSASMKKDQLFGRVQNELENFVRKEVDLFNRVIILGFGNNVSYHYDDLITSIEDKERIYFKIHELKSEDQWTHMSSAFAHLGNRLQELQKAYPESLKRIYVFTDGKNEPDPKLKEKPEYFSEILGKNFSGGQIETMNSFIYLISFGKEIPIELKRINQENPSRVEVMEIPRKPVVDKPIIPIIPPRIALKMKTSQFTFTKDEDGAIEVHFKIESITRDIVLKAVAKGIEKEMAIKKSMRDFSILLQLDTREIGEFEEDIDFNSADATVEIIPNNFKLRYQVKEKAPVRIALRLEKDFFKINKDKAKEISLPFTIVSATAGARLKFIINGTENVTRIEQNTEKFDIPFSGLDLSEGIHEGSISGEVLDQTGSVEPKEFAFTYLVTVPSYTLYYILLVLICLGLLGWAIYRFLPSFECELVFTHEGQDYSKRLKGKFCKPISKVQTGFLIPSGLRICPSRQGKVKVKIPNKLTISKNGMEISQSSVLLRSEDILEFGDIKMKYVFNPSKRRI